MEEEQQQKEQQPETTTTENIELVISKKKPTKEKKGKSKLLQKKQPDAQYVDALEQEIKKPEEKKPEEKTAKEKPNNKKEPKEPRTNKKPKIVNISITETKKQQEIPNVIMHLKCSLKDLDQHNLQYNKMCKNALTYNPEIPPEIMSFSQSQYENNNYSPLMEEEEKITTTAVVANDTNLTNNTIIINNHLHQLAYQTICYKCNDQINTLRDEVANQVANKSGMSKEEILLNSKIKELKISYYKNEFDPKKKSACFWCSYDYENKPFFIPRNETNNTFIVYGSFCTPECAVAYLFKEKIDDTCKFERFHLLNKMYSSPDTNIKPAPNPFYLLDKYLGKLTIQEYRRLLKTQHHSLITVEKPMTRVLPELHTDNETHTFKIKRQSEMVK